MFGKIISSVQNSSFPVDVELSLAHPVADPIEAHVDGFGAFLFDGVVGNSGGGAVVSNNWGGGLGMAEFFKTRA